MEMLIAIAHIGGSIIGVVVLSLFLALIESWDSARNRKRLLEEASIALGVPVEDLDREELTPRFLQVLAERFSGELPGNRVSDRLGVIRTLWVCLGALVQLAVLTGVTWYTFTGSLKTAVHAWWMVAICLFFWGATLVFTLVCQHLTGRYPGQASRARKMLAQLRENQHVVALARAQYEAEEPQERRACGSEGLDAEKAKSSSLDLPVSPRSQWRVL